MTLVLGTWHFVAIALFVVLCVVINFVSGMRAGITNTLQYMVDLGAIKVIDKDGQQVVVLNTQKMMKLYNYNELKDLQQSGQWPQSSYDLLATKYADRFEMCERLFEKMDHEKFEYYNSHDEHTIEDWADENIPDKSYAKRHGGPTFSYDVDYMIGPHDWDSAPEERIGDYVMRKKVYLMEWTGEHYEKYAEKFPELEYFIEMHNDFKPVLEHYYKECFSDQYDKVERVLYKMMLIQYATPTATDSNRAEHRKHNTERFGADHCDETLGGLHLGENYVEFEAKNTASGEWEPIYGLEEDVSLWMFSEHAERSGWLPTYHRMVHNPDPSLGDRYSIIFDLQARYKEEK
jgi:hypothetical protein